MCQDENPFSLKKRRFTFLDIPIDRLYKYMYNFIYIYIYISVQYMYLELSSGFRLQPPLGMVNSERPWYGLVVFAFYSPGPKAQVSFSDQNLFVVHRCRWRCHKLFTFSSSSPESQVQFQPNLAQSIIGWRGFSGRSRNFKTRGAVPAW